ncbi:MAG: hypothetical protein HRU21_09780 [Pseudomonadales bacterium]|nr:hypothetical protein [Pseudomonadales bacterium]
MKGQDIVTRYQRLKGDRYTVEDVWDAIERYIAPYRGRFFKDERAENSIEWRKPFVYDATAIMAAQNLASSLHSRLTSASVSWFDLKFRQDMLNDNQVAMSWLEECSRITYEALQDSNFNVSINETYQDLVCFGTSVLIAEENENKDEDAALNFMSVPIKECYFEQDHKGDVIRVFRHLQWTPLQIVNFFGKEGLPDDVIEAAENPAADPDKKEDIIFCIYRRLDIPETSTAKVIAPEKRPWGFGYAFLKDGKELPKKGGYYERPAFVPRWRKTSSSMWGNSPAMIALADTLTLNRTIELNMTAVEKNLDPPIITTSRGLFGDLNMTAGGISEVRDVNEVKPFLSGARFDVTYQEMDRLRQNIESYFFIPQLILPPMQGTPATAMEISVRMQQLEALIGPTLGRLQTDLLDPAVTRCFGILFRAGKFPEMPDVIAQMGGKVEIEYTSPIAKTQQASNVQSLERYLTTLLGMAEANPNLLDIPDWDEAFKQLANYLGVSAKVNRPSDEVKADREQRQSMQEAQMAGETMQAVAAGEQAMSEVGPQ